MERLVNISVVYVSVFLKCLKQIFLKSKIEMLSEKKILFSPCFYGDSKCKTDHCNHINYFNLFKISENVTLVNDIRKIIIAKAHTRSLNY